MYLNNILTKEVNKNISITVMDKSPVRKKNFSLIVPELQIITWIREHDISQLINSEN